MVKWGVIVYSLSVNRESLFVQLSCHSKELNHCWCHGLLIQWHELIGNSELGTGTAPGPDLLYYWAQDAFNSIVRQMTTPKVAPLHAVAGRDGGRLKNGMSIVAQRSGVKQSPTLLSPFINNKPLLLWRRLLRRFATIDMFLRVRPSIQFCLSSCDVRSKGEAFPSRCCKRKKFNVVKQKVSIIPLFVREMLRPYKCRQNHSGTGRRNSSQFLIPN